MPSLVCHATECTQILPDPVCHAMILALVQFWARSASAQHGLVLVWAHYPSLKFILVLPPPPPLPAILWYVLREGPVLLKLSSFC